MREDAAPAAVENRERREAGRGSAPLYQLKAEFFKTLGHPVRIRVLELLSECEHAVAEMLPYVGVEPAHLSQQLAVLRRAHLVITRKQGSTVFYSLVSPHVAELLKIARMILSGVLAGQAELLEDLRAAAPGAKPGRRPGGQSGGEPEAPVGGEPGVPPDAGPTAQPGDKPPG